MKLYVDDDGYVCFKQPIVQGIKLFWTLHSGGWDAFPEGRSGSVINPLYSTSSITFPTDFDLNDAKQVCREWLARCPHCGKQTIPAVKDNKAKRICPYCHAGYDVFQTSETETK